jgi:hypothetical protein
MGRTPDGGGQARLGAGLRDARLGHDPDGMVVMVIYPGPGQAPLREIPARSYGW